MTQHDAGQTLTLATALSLLGFVSGTELPRLRTGAELARACRGLETLCAEDGAQYPAQRIATDCAQALEDFAARFRAAADQLQPTGDQTHES